MSKMGRMEKEWLYVQVTPIKFHSLLLCPYPQQRQLRKSSAVFGLVYFTLVPQTYRIRWITTVDRFWIHILVEELSNTGLSQLPAARHTIFGELLGP